MYNAKTHQKLAFYTNNMNPWLLYESRHLELHFNMSAAKMAATSCSNDVIKERL